MDRGVVLSATGAKALSMVLWRLGELVGEDDTLSVSVNGHLRAAVTVFRGFRYEERVIDESPLNGGCTLTEIAKVETMMLELDRRLPRVDG